MDWMFWKRKSVEEAKPRHFFVETKMADKVTNKVKFNRYVVTTMERRFPLSDFQRVDGGVVITCFEVNAKSAANCINVIYLEL